MDFLLNPDFTCPFPDNFSFEILRNDGWKLQIHVREGTFTIGEVTISNGSMTLSLEVGSVNEFVMQANGVTATINVNPVHTSEDYGWRISVSE